MLVGIVGKPNVGKTTFFSALTLQPAEIANYPFTTIDPNRGVGYVRVRPCPHEEFSKPSCSPRAGFCRKGIRFVPVEVLDVAGLVPGAHEGKGLGNRFLDELRRASALLHIVDGTGGTSAEGNPQSPGSRHPREDVEFLERELDEWLASILLRGLEREARAVALGTERIEHVLYERLQGIGIDERGIAKALDRSSAGRDPTHWNHDQILDLARSIRELSKPLLVVANKSDLATEEDIQKWKEIPNVRVIPASAESERALRKASESGLVDYLPGDSDFQILDPSRLNEKQRRALEMIRTQVFERFGNTGVVQALEEAVFGLLCQIAVFPVEDETHLTDSQGRVLPDAHLLVRGATARDLAFRVHTELGERFVRAIDARTRRSVGADHPLEHRDVIRVVAHRS